MTEREFAIDIVRRLRDAGHQALWAGGCVRDQLLGLEPHDYDVATDARPDRVQELFRRTIAVGVSFGVVEVLGPKPLRVQVATFRSDGRYDDGRRPVAVTFSSPEEDAQRRDFTINGLFFDPMAGRVIDYVGGEADLRAGVIRAIGDPAQRFTEDKLRLIRAMRFAARFGFTIEPATAAAIRKMADQITAVSAERIADELRKMLVDPRRAAAAALLDDLGLLTAIMPELAADPAKPRLSIAVLGRLGIDITFPLGLAALAGNLSVTSASESAERLRLSNAETDRLIWLIGNRAALHDAAELPLHRFKPLLAHPGILELLALMKADRREADAAYCEKCLHDWPRDRIDPPPLITGDDLRALGLSPGPRFKTLLDAVRAAQLDETIHTRDEALNLVRALL